MGLGSFLKKSIKNNFRGGSMWKFASKAAKPVEDEVRSMLGLDALKDLAGAQEAQLHRQQEANKLDASVESQNVAQFDDTSDAGFTGTDSRRKKKQSGAYSQALGLQL